MRQSKHMSRLLMGGILSVSLAGLVPVVYAQGGGGGGAGAGAGGATGGAAAGGGSTGSGGMSARVLRQARARVHRLTDRWEIRQLIPFQIPHLQQAL